MTATLLLGVRYYLIPIGKSRPKKEIPTTSLFVLERKKTKSISIVSEIHSFIGLVGNQIPRNYRNQN